MPVLWEQIGFGVAAFAVATIARIVARPLGGALYSITSAPTLIPWLGRVYEALFIKLLRVSYLAKIGGLIVSASGVLIVVEALRHGAPQMLEIRAVVIGLLAATTVATLEVLHRVHLMEMPDFDGALAMIQNWFPRHSDAMAAQRTRLAHANFAQSSIIDFLTIVFGLGLTLYLGDCLGVFGKHGTIATPLNGLIAAFKVVQLDLAPQPLPQGLWAVGIRAFYGLSLLIYTVFFLAIATNLITPEPKSDLKEVVEAFSAGYLAHASAEGAPPPGEQALSQAVKRWKHGFPRRNDSGRTRYFREDR